MTEAADPWELRLARPEDADAIAALMLANAPDRGGTLTGRFDRAKVDAALADMPVLVARHRGELAGVLVSGSHAAGARHPVVAGMLAAYRGGADAYVYGPVCVDARWRGQGVAAKLFVALKRELPGREGILFIRQDNAASLRAHQKMGMTPRGPFAVDGVDYFVLSYR